MAFPIRNAEAEQLLRELCALTGENLTEAVRKTLRLGLEDERQELDWQHRIANQKKYISKMEERVSRLPVLDQRSDEEILGYDEPGLP